MRYESMCLREHDQIDWYTSMFGLTLPCEVAQSWKRHLVSSFIPCVCKTLHLLENLCTSSRVGIFLRRVKTREGI